MSTRTFLVIARVAVKAHLHVASMHTVMQALHRVGCNQGPSVVSSRSLRRGSAVWEHASSRPAPALTHQNVVVVAPCKGGCKAESQTCQEMLGLPRRRGADATSGLLPCTDSGQCPARASLPTPPHQPPAAQVAPQLARSQLWLPSERLSDTRSSVYAFLGSQVAEPGSLGLQHWNCRQQGTVGGLWRSVMHGGLRKPQPAAGAPQPASQSRRAGRGRTQKRMLASPSLSSLQPWMPP